MRPLRMNFRLKIILLFLSTCMIIIGILGYTFFYFASHSISRNNMEANQNMVRQMNLNIDALQNSTYDFSLMVLLNPDNYINPLKLYNLSYSQHLFSMIVASNHESQSIYGVIDGGNKRMIEYAEFEQSGIYREIIEAKGKPVWFASGDDAFKFEKSASSDRVVMARAMVSLYNSFQSKDILMLGIPIHTLADRCGVDDLLPHQEVLITDANQELLYQSNEWLENGFDIQVAEEGEYGEAVHDDTKYLVFETHDNMFGWHIFFFTESKSILSNEIPAVMAMVAAAMACVMLIAIILILFISSSLTKPIRGLLNSMEELGRGNWNHYVEITSHDEIGQLGIHYNAMIDQLRRLVEENYVLTLREREAELSALQAKINPHFLYNTLATFYAMSIEAGHSKLAKLVIALSQLFRITLSKGNTWITVAEEKEFLENYLLLQKQQMGDRLQYLIDIPPDILKCMVPKLILQPFIENAVKHGLDPMAQGGTLKVTGRKDGRWLLFTIWDDGAGMDAEALDGICTPPQHKVSDGGYAIWNVRERLKLYFEDEYCLEFESLPKKGLLVRLTFPCKENH